MSRDPGTAVAAPPGDPRPTRPQKLSVIVPVYNEELLIEEVLQRIHAAPLPDGVTREVIVVDDGSTDRTRALVEAMRGDSDDLFLHTLARNSGKGSAIREGLRRATGDIILIQDGDLEYDPREHARMIEPILKGRAAVVYGSRFRGTLKGMHPLNFAANKLLTFLANLLYRVGITDEATAYKAFRADLLRSIPLRCRRFEFCPEVTAKLGRRRLRIHEVPISYDGRSASEGKKIGWRDGWEAIWTLLRYRLGE